MSAKVEDIADLAAEGRLPEDPKSQARPVNAAAKRLADEERRLITVRQMLKGSVERALAPRDKVSPSCTSGHYAIDRDTGGIMPEFVWLFGAETNWGKSSNAVMLTDENLKLGKRVLICSAEDSESLYGNRLLIRRSGVDAHRFKIGKLTPEESSRIVRVANSAEDLPVFLDCRGKPVEWTAKRVRQIIAAEGIDLVLFDYLQAMDQEKPQSDRRLQLNYIARTLTDVVKTSGKAAVIYSQLTEPEDGKRPTRRNIRDSRDVANAAEVIALGWTPVVDVQDKQKRVLAKADTRCIILDKNKDGPKKKLYTVKWSDSMACFETVPDPDERPDYVKNDESVNPSMPSFEEPERYP